MSRGVWQKIAVCRGSPRLGMSPLHGPPSARPVPCQVGLLRSRAASDSASIKTWASTSSKLQARNEEYLHTSPQLLTGRRTVSTCTLVCMLNMFCVHCTQNIAGSRGTVHELCDLLTLLLAGSKRFSLWCGGPSETVSRSERGEAAFERTRRVVP